jgi:hypothetical protein
MGTKQYDSATDLLTFSRASGGTALSKISYGNELVTNGTFDSDLSGWETSHGTLGGEFDNGTVKLGHTVYNSWTRQVLSGLVVGTTYEVKFSVTNDTQGGGGGSYVGIWETNSDASYIERFTYTKGVVGSYTFTFTATSTVSQIRLTKGSNTGVTNFDNVSIKEVLFDQADGTLQLYNYPNNVPRIEYDATGAVKGLLIEEARTNLVTYSNDLTVASWLKTNNSNTANAGVSPDGTSNANKVVPTTSSGVHYTYQTLNFSSTDHSFSVYVASAGYGFATICAGTIHNTNHYAVVIDLSNGTQTALYSMGTHSKTVTVEPVGSFYRVTISGDGEKYYVVGASDTGTYTPSDYGFKSFQGDGTSGILVYGAQAEAGAFPTSYIPTTGATATRARDLAEIPTSAFGYNNDQGSVAVEFKSNKPSSDFYGAFVLSDGSPTNRIVHYTFNGGQHRGAVVSSGVLEVDVVAGSRGAPSELVKFAVGFSDNNFAASLNGATAVTDTSVTIPSGLSKLALGYYYPTNPQSNMLNGHIKSIQYYPRRLTDTQLQELTT